MEEFVTLTGAIFAAFFLLSLAVETVLENFRGVLSLLGFTILKSQTSMQQALDEVADLVPSNQKELARFQALVTFVEQKSSGITASLERIRTIREDIEKAVDPQGRLGIVDREKEWIAAACAPFKLAMERSEEKRVFTLRIISAVIGVGIAYSVGLNVLDFVQMGQTVDTKGYYFLGYVLCGLAAAGGSSFWHDQLDRIRSLKQIGQQLVSVVPAKNG